MENRAIEQVKYLIQAVIRAFLDDFRKSAKQ